MQAEWSRPAVLVLLLAAGLTRAGAVVISEFMASNTRTLTDADGDHSDWIELDKGIRAARAALFAPFDRYLSRLADFRGRAGDERSETRLIAEFRERAVELNKQIDLFNLKAPSSRVHHARIRIAEEVDRFREAAEKWRGA